MSDIEKVALLKEILKDLINLDGSPDFESIINIDFAKALLEILNQ